MGEENIMAVRSEYQDYFPWSKGGRCVGLITLSHSCADCFEILETQTLVALKTCPVLQWNCFTCISFVNTVLTFSWKDWQTTIWCTTAWKDCYQADFHTEQLRTRVETRNRLSKRKRLNILRCCNIWRFLYSHSCVCEVSFNLRYGATSTDALSLKYRDRLLLWKYQEKITYSHCVKSLKNRIFMHLFAKREIRCW